MEEKEQHTEDAATTIHVFVLYCSPEIRFDYWDCIQKIYTGKFSYHLGMAYFDLLQPAQ